MSRPFLLGLGSLVACGLAVLADGAGTERPPYYEQDDPAVTWSGPWSTKLLAASSGGSARLAMDPGAQVSFGFTGTSVAWIGYRDEWCGLAEVALDGVLQATVDTYSTPARAQATIYTLTGLGRGAHTLAIRATGTHNAASAGSWVWVDAFSIAHASASGLDSPPILMPSRPFPSAARRTAGEGRSGRRTRLSEEGTRFALDDDALTWSGAWSTNRLAVHSGGVARLSMEPSSRVSLVFTGTGVSWIGYRDEWSGIADVVLDGRLRTTVDTYSSPARAQAVVFTIDGLSEGTHRLTIQPTGRRRPASGGAWIWVDAFSISR